VSTDLEWRTASTAPVDPARFGVDHRGTINHDHMRTHVRRHPVLAATKRTVSFGGADGSRYPTRLAGGEELPGHDDYDCLDDLVAAGLLEVHMPSTSEHNGAEVFVDAYGRPAADPDGDPIHVDDLTGYDELWLCAYATFALTERGVKVASRLRQHKAAGNSFGTFRME
jgi:hypothetical protein